MDFLNHLLDSSQVPVFTAFLLGLLTALSPCPLATNVTAVGYITRGCMRAMMTSKGLVVESCGVACSIPLVELLPTPFSESSSFI